MNISIIAAVSQNNVIGINNKIPWHIKEDLIHLKNLTLGKTVIVGKNTYISMEGYYEKSGREMPGKKYLILSNDISYSPKRSNAYTGSVQEAFENAKKDSENEVFVIGGKMVFETFLPLANKMYITKILKDYEGDTFFPKYNENEWKLVKKEEKFSDTENINYEFLTMERIK